MDDLITQVKRFVEPASIAMIGVSSRTGPESFNAMENMIKCGYKGRIYAVNPRGGEILGVKVYPSISEVPEVVDLAVISTPRAVVPDIVRECVARGIKAVAIITQGFADADEEGKRMQAEIAAAVEGTGTRVVGPNTLGVANSFIDLYTSFVPYTNRKMANGVICQSGIFLAGAPDFTAGLGIGIDIGNTADLDFVKEELYQAVKEIIHWYMEGTDYNIGMAEDGLLSAGSPDVQLTWMDAKVDDWVVTPRHGKAVEINALWYNAVCILKKLALIFGDDFPYPELPGRIKESFQKKFWNGSYFVDVISPEGIDCRVRPNQLLAVSLPYT
ncbi:MAG: CoA-binding protein, partial [Peptococcaceae bacterium]|nr:CoA-binding protein [Peptococcaceae bacterium]